MALMSVFMTEVMVLVTTEWLAQDINVDVIEILLREDLILSLSKPVKR